MMPSVDAGSSQFATPRAERKTGDWTAKNAKTTTAPTSAPSSGVTSSRRSGPRAVSRSSAHAAPSVPASAPALGGAQRVPAEARSAISSTLSASTMPGPVRTG